MEVVKDFELRRRKAVSCVVERRCRNGLSRRCPRRCLATVEARCQEEAQKKKAEKKARWKEDSRERRIRNEIAQEVVVGITETTSAHEDVKSTAQRTAGQSVKRNWDCSQSENEEEEEEEDWQKEDQMEVQWAEDEKLEDILERRKMEGGSLQAEVMQKVSELVVHERVSQGEKRELQKKRRNLKDGLLMK